MGKKIKITAALLAAMVVSVAAIHAYAGNDGPETVGNAQKFNELFKEQAEAHNYRPIGTDYYYSISSHATESSADFREFAASDTAVMGAVSDAGGSVSVVRDDFSQTNVQVEGVDESDIIKTDGKYIYHLTNNTLYITEADGKGNMKTVSATALNIENEKPFYIAGSNTRKADAAPQGERESVFYPSDMYVDGDTLCLIGWSQPALDLSARGRDAQYGYHFRPNFTKAVVYDIKDRANPAYVRDFNVEGNLIASRKVDDMLYLVINHYMNFYGVTQPSDVVPLYRDSVTTGDRFYPVSYMNMRYFPGRRAESILIICGLDLSKPNQAAKVESLLGMGSQVYMSRESLYVTHNEYSYSIVQTGIRDVIGQSEEITTFYKFGLKNGAAVYESQASLSGHVLNQYSMDEHNGYFRAVMTTGRFTSESKNTLAILDKNMKQTGSIDDMAPGEQIYSARFMGDRAFMVTFRTVDPLFAFDLSDPQNPVVLGELKIPGYSTYLHPYDENFLIGFGRDTEEMKTIDSQGRVVNEWVTNKGLKLSLFDVTDMTNPKEVSAVSIGNEYTHSELLYNPKAWLFDKEKGFVAFPVHHNNYGYMPETSEKFDDFNGVYVYDIDTKGLKLRGTFEIQEEEKKPPRDVYASFYYQNPVQRVLYIGDTFYAAFMNGVQANGMEDLNFIGVVYY